MKIYDLVIIGGGPSGYAAALYGARAGFDTLVVEKALAGGQMTLTDVIDNYPGFDDGVDGFELSEKMQKGAERFGAKTQYGEVLDVDFAGDVKKISTSFGEVLAYAVIISTGANPRKLDIAREGEFVGRGIHYCAHCDGRFYKDKTVAVIGGGNSAVSDALHMSNLAKKVYLIHRRDELRADKIYRDAIDGKTNIEKVFSAEVKEVLGEQKFSGLKLTVGGESRELAVDGAFVSIGRVPATEPFVGKIELDGNGYVKSGEDTKTNVDGVYVAGDVRSKPLRQVVTAVSDGAVAAHFAEEYILKVRPNG